MNRTIIDWELPCPEADCEDGTILVSLPGGRFNMHEQQWFPAERESACPTCNGRGTVLASDMRWIHSDGQLLHIRDLIDLYPFRITRHDIKRVIETPARRAPSASISELPF